MTSPSANHLGKARIRQLLAAVGSGSAPEPTNGDPTAYDWRDPHYLNTDQLNRLAAVMSQVAAKLGDVFTRFFTSEFNVAPTAVTQHFADDLRRCIDLDRCYCQTFGPDKGQPCGFFAISSETTAAWATRLLGDTESAGGSNRRLSSLEESLLSDLGTAVSEAFLVSLRPHENLKSDGRLSKGQPAIQFERTEEICRIAFQIKETGKDTSSDITFLLSCSRLAALVGKPPLATAPRSTPQEHSQALMEHLHQMSITVTARLASIRVNFQEVLDLCPGDILLLDKPVREMVELVIDNGTAFRGCPVQSAGQYAFLVREARTSRTQETPALKEPRKG